MSCRHFRKNLKSKPQGAPISARSIVDYGDADEGCLQALGKIDDTALCRSTVHRSAEGLGSVAPRALIGPAHCNLIWNKEEK
jgi:hypothetical protein